jgi:DNA gyrase subunit A
MAMRLEAGDHIVGVQLCTDAQDVLLTTALGRCIRFSVGEVRVFAGRESTGVRGVRLAEGDQVISMAILRSVDATPAERLAYLRHSSAMRAALTGSPQEEPSADTTPDEDVGDDVSVDLSVTPERIAQLGAAEEFVLTVADTGLGKRTSSYDYRRTGRGGQGLIAHDLSRKGGRLVASFPVEDSDDLLLVTDGGQLIRTPVGDVRITGRNSQGVIILRTADKERVVSVERLAEPADAGAAEPADPDED